MIAFFVGFIIMAKIDDYYYKKQLIEYNKQELILKELIYFRKNKNI